MIKYADNPEAVNLIRDPMIFGKFDSLLPYFQHYEKYWCIITDYLF